MPLAACAQQRGIGQPQGAESATIQIPCRRVPQLETSPLPIAGHLVLPQEKPADRTGLLQAGPAAIQVEPLTGLDRRITATEVFGGNRMLRIYHGSSMQGIFCTNDMLDVLAVSIDRLMVGDIIAFRSLDGTREIVHRVISRLPGGLKTQGDRSPHPDADLVTVDRYIGKVIEVIRGNRRIPIHGGRWGQWLVLQNRLRRDILGFPAWIVRPIRRRFGDEPLVALATRLPGACCVDYAGPDGTRIRKLVWSGTTLAQKNTESIRWHIRLLR